jgi:hypothetical protein
VIGIIFGPEVFFTPIVLTFTRDFPDDLPNTHLSRRAKIRNILVISFRKSSPAQHGLVLVVPI